MAGQSRSGSRSGSRSRSGAAAGSQSGRAARIEVLLRRDGRGGEAELALLGRLARRYLRDLGASGTALSVLLTSDRRIRALNREFRGRDRATDVLSFPAGDMPLLPGEPRLLGDVTISLDTAGRRAREDGRPVGPELARYLAHGLLHLLGYDHEGSGGDARRMARMEERLLRGPGLVQTVAPRPRRASRRSGFAVEDRGPARRSKTLTGRKARP